MNFARIKRVSASAVFGLAIFGAWAYAVNFHDPERRLTSAVSQGMFSFFFSLVVMSITEGIFALLAGRRWQVPLAIAVPVATSVGCASLIHLAAHTPSIVLTLLGPALIGAAYQTAYVLNLRRRAASMRPRGTFGSADARADRIGAADPRARC
jgi:uncharacterized integral membrane protein